MNNNVYLGLFKEEYSGGSNYKYFDFIVRNGKIAIDNDREVIMNPNRYTINFNTVTDELDENLYEMSLSGLVVYYTKEKIHKKELVIPYEIFEGDRVIRLGYKNDLDAFIKNAVVLKDGKLEGVDIDMVDAVKFAGSGITDLMETLSLFCTNVRNVM